jgi:hypothetical protein
MQRKQSPKLEENKMSNTKTGGPAFPQASYNMKGGYDIIGGMTLRDYFAAKAMVGWLTTWEFDESVNAATLAEFCYRMADAMLAERDKK